jgi:hypothetical protein
LGSYFTTDPKVVAYDSWCKKEWDHFCVHEWQDFCSDETGISCKTLPEIPKFGPQQAARSINPSRPIPPAYRSIEDSDGKTRLHTPDDP